jgi:hypothetical protein
MTASIASPWKTLEECAPYRHPYRPSCVSNVAAGFLRKQRKGGHAASLSNVQCEHARGDLSHSALNRTLNFQIVAGPIEPILMDASLGPLEVLLRWIIRHVRLRKDKADSPHTDDTPALSKSSITTSRDFGGAGVFGYLAHGRSLRL